MKNLPIYVLLFFAILMSCSEKKNSNTKDVTIATNQAKESQQSFDQRMEWWRDAKFGMFIHWGVYSVPAGIYKGEEVPGIGEWIMDKAHIPIPEYEVFARQFNPVNFNADDWAKTMKNAGMKYVVITSKHHDGFALWDSKLTDYDMVDFTPFKRDVLKELSQACARQGIRFGLYHSIMDWHHPEAQAPNYPEYNTRDTLRKNPDFPKYFEYYLKPQVKELIDNFDPAILWFDGEWIPDYTHEMGQELYHYLRDLKPDLIINNRVDKGRQGMQGMNREDAEYAGDFGTPEQEILESAADVDWESCMTMNDTWGFKKNDSNWKSTEELIHNLIDVAAKGGNYLLNVGPTAQGDIPRPSLDRLEEMGEWLSVNGEAIYGTEKLKNDFRQGENIRYTKKKGESVYYAIYLTKPENEMVFENVKPVDDSEIFLLGASQSLVWNYDENAGLKIQVPEAVLQTAGENYGWVFVIRGEEVL